MMADDGSILDDDLILCCSWEEYLPAPVLIISTRTRIIVVQLIVLLLV